MFDYPQHHESIARSAHTEHLAKFHLLERNGAFTEEVRAEMKRRSFQNRFRHFFSRAIHPHSDRKTLAVQQAQAIQQALFAQQAGPARRSQPSERRQS